MMNGLIWLLRGILFVILLGLAIKNSGDVELRFYFDASWQAPLALVVLVAFGLGIVLGALVLVPRLYRQRRSISRLQRMADRDATRTTPSVPTAEEPPRSAAR